DGAQAQAHTREEARTAGAARAIVGNEHRGVAEITGHVIATVGLSLLAERLGQATTGLHDHGGAARRLPGGHVGERIADIVALAEVKVVFARRAEEEAGLRLAAPTAVLWAVRAHVDARDPAAMAGHQRAHPRVQRV